MVIPRAPHQDPTFLQSVWALISLLLPFPPGMKVALWRAVSTSASPGKGTIQTFVHEASPVPHKSLGNVQDSSPWDSFLLRSHIVLLFLCLFRRPRIPTWSRRIHLHIVTLLNRTIRKLFPISNVQFTSQVLQESSLATLKAVCLFSFTSIILNSSSDYAQTFFLFL